jgi:flagellar FliJ protein
MKNGFTFRLNKVLEVKEVQYKQQQKGLMLAAQRKTQAQRQLIEKQQHTREFAEQLSRPRRLSAGALYLSYAHYMSLIDEMNEQERHLMSLEEKEKQEREKLMAVHKERKILETLREKEYDKYQLNMIKRDQKELDELASIGARRRSVENL